MGSTYRYNIYSCFPELSHNHVTTIQNHVALSALEGHMEGILPNPIHHQSLYIGPPFTVTPPISYPITLNISYLSLGQNDPKKGD